MAISPAALVPGWRPGMDVMVGEWEDMVIVAAEEDRLRGVRG